jgi:hypothetical protein
MKKPLGKCLKLAKMTQVRGCFYQFFPGMRSRFFININV